MTIMAIDPGLTGAIAVYNPTRPAHIDVHDMPVIDGAVDPFAIFRIITHAEPDFAYVERVGPMPRDGVKQAWRFSGAFHTAITVIKLARVPMLYVTPASWKKSMKVSGGPSGKEECRAMAISMFPTCEHMFSRKKDHGRAEAALLALYAHQLNWRPTQ